VLHYAHHGKLPAVGSAVPTTQPLDREIARAMDPDPGQRHASAGELRDALRAIAVVERLPRRPARRWLIAWIAGLVLGVAAVGAWWLHARRGPSLTGAWHMRSEPIGDRGSGAFVVDVTRDGDDFVMDYHSGLMRCTFTDRRCAGTWYGRSGEGWYYLDLADDGASFVGRWGYSGGDTRSAEIRGTLVEAKE